MIIWWNVNQFFSYIVCQLWKIRIFVTFFEMQSAKKYLLKICIHKELGASGDFFREDERGATNTWFFLWIWYQKIWYQNVSMNLYSKVWLKVIPPCAALTLILCIIYCFLIEMKCVSSPIYGFHVEFVCTSKAVTNLLQSIHLTFIIMQKLKWNSCTFISIIMLMCACTMDRSLRCLLNVCPLTVIPILCTNESSWIW